MFKFNWSIALASLGYIVPAITVMGAIWFSYWIGYDLGEDHGNTAYSAEYHENYAADRIERECIDADDPSFDLHECIQKEIQASTEHHTAYADLKSQERMAFWAVLMGAFTGLTVIVTGVGVVFIRMTLVQTNKTNEAAVDAANAASTANEIMTQQGAGYLVIESIQIQAQAEFVLVLATVKNIGQRPVRMGNVEGKITFDWQTIDEYGIPSRHAVSSKVSIFIGVVEQMQEAKGVNVVRRKDLTESADDYVDHILRADSADIDCKVSWSANMSPLTSERHIMHTNTDTPIFDPSFGEVINLKVAYSGYSMDWEKRAANRES